MRGIPTFTPELLDDARRAHRLTITFDVLGYPPCTGCAWSPRCAAELLACGAFVEWCGSGEGIRASDDRPTRQRYKKLFEG